MLRPPETGLESTIARRRGLWCLAGHKAGRGPGRALGGSFEHGREHCLALEVGQARILGSPAVGFSLDPFSFSEVVSEVAIVVQGDRRGIVHPQALNRAALTWLAPEGDQAPALEAGRVEVCQVAGESNGTRDLAQGLEKPGMCCSVVTGPVVKVDEALIATGDGAAGQIPELMLIVPAGCGPGLEHVWRIGIDQLVTAPRVGFEEGNPAAVDEVQAGAQPGVIVGNGDGAPPFEGLPVEVESDDLVSWTHLPGDSASSGEGDNSDTMWRQLVNDCLVDACCGLASGVASHRSSIAYSDDESKRIADLGEGGRQRQEWRGVPASIARGDGPRGSLDLTMSARAGKVVFGEGIR